MDIRREIDSTSYMHKDLLQKARTLVNKVTSEGIHKLVTSIDPESLDATNHDLDSNPSATSQPVAEDPDVDTIVLDNSEALEYGNPTLRCCLTR